MLWIYFVLQEGQVNIAEEEASSILATGREGIVLC